MATHHVVSYFPDWGLNPRFLQFKNRILTTGMPGKFPGFLVLFAGVWNTQSCGHEQSSVPLHISAHLPKVYRCSCVHRWISFSRADNVGTYKYSHRLVLTYVLMCVDLCMRTCRNTGTPTVLCFTDNALKKNKLDIYGNAVSGKDINTTFPTAYAHFMFLCHILIILAVFQTILSLLYLLFWSVMSDFYYYPINAQMISILLAVKYWK